MKTLFLYEDGQTITKANERIEVIKDKTVILSEPIISISDIVLMGNIQITAQALKKITSNNINITHSSKSGKIYAFTNSMSSDRSRLRCLQYEAYNNLHQRLLIAKTFCKKKIILQRKYLLEKKRKLHKKYDSQITFLMDKLSQCNNINEVLGVEGQAANIYFKAISDISSIFKFRTRRPAFDIFNALLNLSYSLLLNKINSVIFSKGLDTQIGFLHSIKNGRPSLSLDFLELFRTKADNFVTLITNRKEFVNKDFDIDKETGGYILNKNAFSRYIAKFTESIDICDEIEKECNAFIISLKSKDVSLFE